MYCTHEDTGSSWQQCLWIYKTDLPGSPQSRSPQSSPLRQFQVGRGELSGTLSALNATEITKSTVLCCSSCLSQQRELQFQMLRSGNVCCWVKKITGCVENLRGRGKFLKTSGLKVVKLLLYTLMSEILYRESKVPSSIWVIVFFVSQRCLRLVSPELTTEFLRWWRFCVEFRFCIEAYPSLPKACLSIDEMWLLARFKLVSLLSPVNTPPGRTVILFPAKSRVWRDANSEKASVSINVIWLPNRERSPRFFSPAHNPDSRTVILLPPKFRYWREVNPEKASVSIDVIWLQIEPFKSF